ncbi:MAG TPA: DUF2284 domain-containing protein, partial [Firmicutes bacterium]|nr:DUF2284 domain-containing protein [Bacillota bacterium]
MLRIQLHALRILWALSQPEDSLLQTQDRVHQHQGQVNPVVDKKLIEEHIASLPIYQYEFFSASELVFESKVRQICRSECPMYGRSWSCPPAVGTFDQCRERCLSYGEAMLLVTAAEVDDASDMAS